MQIFSREGTRSVVDGDTGEPLPSFEGVAYEPAAGVYVYTTLVDGGRCFRELGSGGYEGALEEAEVLRRQMSFGF